MIELQLNPINIFISDINSINIDLIALLYDIFIASITGYIVWFKTDEYMQRRDEREQFVREQQEYSRYLGRLNIKIRSYKHRNEYERLEIEDLLENEPIREVFVFETSPEKDTFYSLSIFFAQIQGCLNNDSGFQPTLLKISREISKCRLELLSFRIKQPSVKIWKLWGRPALAKTQFKNNSGSSIRRT